MERRKSLIIMFMIISVVAVLAVIASIISFYLGSPTISGTPTNLSVVNLEGDYYLTADYSSEYSYQFVIEQKIGDEYVEVDDAYSDVNILNLKEQNIALNAGTEFRFKAAYSTENGSIGDYSNYIEWIFVPVLDKAEPFFEDGVLSWGNVPFASYYTLIITNPNGQSSQVNISENRYDFTESSVGVYAVYVQAKNDSGYITSTSNLVTFSID